MESYLQLLSVAIKAAVLAGKEIKDVYGTSFTVDKR